MPPDVQTHEGSQPRSASEAEHSSPEQRQPVTLSQAVQMLVWWAEQSSAAVAAVPYELPSVLSQVQTLSTQIWS